MGNEVSDEFYYSFKASGRRRLRVLLRDDFTCVYCGYRGANVEMEVDHFVPMSRGGKDSIKNMVTACRRCNQSKGDMLFEEWLAMMRVVLSRHGGPR